MSNLAFLKRPVVARKRRVFPSTDPLAPEVRLALRSELFLIAHDDQTGREHLDRRFFCLGLAGSVLLELSLEQRIMIGGQYVIRDGRYIHDPGRILIKDPDCYGDPLTDAAITLLNRTGGPLHVTDFIRQFATLDLYDQVKGDMLATRVLRRTTYRKFWPFGKKDRYLAVRPFWAVQARTKVRDLAVPRKRNDPTPDFPDLQTIALTALVTALGLTRNLFHTEPGVLHGRLMDIITGLHSSTARDVHAAITPTNRRHVR
ncbi:MAG TPA: GPP34 family phosphoprotein [Micromonosporaceae bacterium]|jgi:hypothetical protein|nr:GPP34 family phosphoprotein [Micromonosporaceae bacterium]